MSNQDSVTQREFFLDGELVGTFRFFIDFLFRDNASWNDNEALVVVIFKESLELSLEISREGLGLIDKVETFFIAKIHKVKERLIELSETRQVFSDQLIQFFVI